MRKSNRSWALFSVRPTTSLGELRGFNETWKQILRDNSRAAHVTDRLSYLSRWVAQLKEKQFQLIAFG